MNQPKPDIIDHLLQGKLTEREDYDYDEILAEFSVLLVKSYSLKALHYRLLADKDFVYPHYDKLFRLLGLMPELLTVIDNLPHQHYRFSHLLEQWIHCYRKYPVKLDGRLSHTCQKPFEFLYPSVSSYLCIFLTEVYYALTAKDYANKLNYIRIESQKNHDEYSSYVDNLFSCHSRLVVIRVDLFYKPDIASFQSFETAKEDLATLHNNARRNLVFRDLEGYVTKVEYGLKKKVHIHAFFFFNGHTRLGRSDVYLAQQIGEYWKNTVTKGRGEYWNCNHKKEQKYRYVGIGLVTAKDDLKQQYLKRALEYLCKKETQVIKPRDKPQAKALTRGDLRNKNSNLGRDRKF